MRLSSEEARRALLRLFARQRIADRDAVFAALKTRSRMTLYRRLSEVGYWSSYTNAGGYYTLKDIPVFDADGLWLYRRVGFSRDGTLKKTVVRLVDQADAGRLHRELEALLHIRVHNTVLELCHQGDLGRALVGGEYLYVNADAKRAAAQVAAREKQSATGARAALRPLGLPQVIDVLVAVIQASNADAWKIATKLQARGLDVTPEQVEAVFVTYRIKKKTRSRSRRWRR